MENWTKGIVAAKGATSSFNQLGIQTELLINQYTSSVDMMIKTCTKVCVSNLRYQAFDGCLFDNMKQEGPNELKNRPTM